MRWSCPHCGINLALADEKVGTGWAFSRCYQCAGFALVRRPEVNVVKVDKAPNGEKILLPEATEELLLSRDASKNLNKNATPVIKPSTRGKSIPNVEAKPSPSASAIAQVAQQIQNSPTPPVARPVTAAPVASASPALPIAAKLPEPLPEAPTRTLRARLIPVGVGLAGAIAVSSGLYLFVQGRALIAKSKVAAAQRANLKGSADPSKIVTHTEVAKTNLVVDHVVQQAMAPLRAPSNSPLTPFFIKPRTHQVALHTGPGAEFPIVRRVDPEEKLMVTEWKEHWLKVTSQSKSAQAENPKSKELWMRNENAEVSTLD